MERERLADLDTATNLLPQVLAELRSLAAHCLSKERKDHTLEPTELVHEAYLKLATKDGSDWQSKTHFYAIAASAVRQVLVDHARRHRAQKRGHGQRQVTLHDEDAINDLNTIDVLALDEALQRLQRLDPRQKQIVEMRFFGGLKIEEIAKVLNISPRTVKGSWRAARAWLTDQMRDS